MIFLSKECNNTIRFKSAPKKADDDKSVKYVRHVAYQWLQPKLYEILEYIVGQSVEQIIVQIVGQIIGNIV